MRNLLSPTLPSAILAIIATGVLLGSRYVAAAPITRNDSDFLTGLILVAVMFFPMLLVVAMALVKSAQEWQSATHYRFVAIGIIGLAILWMIEQVFQYLFLHGSVPAAARFYTGWPRLIVMAVSRAICLWLIASPLVSAVSTGKQNAG